MMSYCTRPLSILLAMLALAASGTALGQVKSALPGKELVAVLELDGVGASKAQVAGLSEQLRAELLNTGQYRLVDRAQVDKILNEQALQQTGCTSQECAVQVGKILGVRKLVTGRVTKIEDSLWQVSALLVDAETAETVRAATINHQGSFGTLLTGEMAPLAQKLIGVPVAGKAAPVASSPLLSPRPSVEQPLHTFTGHDARVYAVAISPDGRVAASGSEDKTVKLWDLASGREIRTLSGHAGTVVMVAFSPDGKRILSGSEDFTVRVWEVATGGLILTLRGADGWPVRAGAWSPDGTTIAMGGFGTLIKVSDAATGQEIRKLWGRNLGSVYAIAFSPDGRRILSGYDAVYDTLVLWDAATGAELHRQDLRSHDVHAIAFTPDGKRALLGTANAPRVWDVANWREERVLGRSGELGDVYSVAVSPDGKLALTGAYHGLMLWDMAGGRRVRTFTGSFSNVRAVAFTPDGQTVLSTARNTMALWQIAP